MRGTKREEELEEELQEELEEEMVPPPPLTYYSMAWHQIMMVRCRHLSKCRYLHQQAPPIVQETWADWCGSLVRKTYGQAAIEVKKGHNSQHLMVSSMTLFIKDLAKEVVMMKK